jgi:hypothetical protein
MSVSIKKLSDDVFEVTVAKTSTTTHTVTVTDQSLTDLTDDNATKTQLLEFSLNFLLAREYFPDYRDKVRRSCDEG